MKKIYFFAIVALGIIPSFSFAYTDQFGSYDVTDVSAASSLGLPVASDYFVASTSGAAVWQDMREFGADATQAQYITQYSSSSQVPIDCTTNYVGDGVRLLGRIEGGLYVVIYTWECVGGVKQEAAIPFDFSKTQVIYTQPSDGQTVASTSVSGVIRAYIYYAETNVEDDLVLTQTWMLNSDVQVAVASPTLLQSNWSIELAPNVGYHLYGTSTVPLLRTGEYTLKSTISKKTWLTDLASSFFGAGFFGVVYSTTTTFTVVAPNSFDNTYGLAHLADLASSTPFYTACQIGSFNLADCFVGFFAWDTPTMSNQFNLFTDELTHNAPLGYITRVFDILSASTTATTTDLILAFSFPNSLTGFGGDAVSFNISQGIRDADSILRTSFPLKSGGNVTLWDVLMPILKVIMAIMIIFYVIHRLLNVKRDRVSAGHVTDEQYRYKEKLYELSQRR